MGDMASFAIGIALVVGFLAFGAVLYSTASVQGGYVDDAASYKLLNSSLQYQNESVNFSNELQNSITQSQLTDPSLSILAEGGLVGAAITKTIVFLFKSLNIATDLVLSTPQIFAIFGLPEWITATIIVCISLFVGFAVLSAIIRWAT